MPTVLELYDQATLSLAAYGTFPSGYPRYPNVNELTNDAVGMSQKQAEMFASTNANGWQVLAQYTGDVYDSGASATVFQDASGKKYLAIRGTEADGGDVLPPQPNSTMKPIA